MQRPTQKELLKSILTRERNRRELTQEEVAEAVGVSPRTYQRWEQGRTFPHPYYLRKLREFFGVCIDEIYASRGSGDELNGSSEKISYRKDRFFIFLHDRRFDRLALIAFVSILIISIGAGFFLHLTHPYGFGPVKPGGVWISPNSPTVGDIVNFEAYAYPTHPTDPAIDYVNFTAYWPGVDPRVWKIVCQIRIPVRQDVFACDANLKQLEAPPGQISISFDVYDRQGNINFAPNGIHHITFLPSPLVCILRNC